MERVEQLEDAKRIGKTRKAGGSRPRERVAALSRGRLLAVNCGISNIE